MEKIQFKTRQQVEIIEVSKNVPDSQIEDFKEWLMYKAVENGTGCNIDYYAYTEDSKDDIEVKYTVRINKIKKS